MINLRCDREGLLRVTNDRSNVEDFTYPNVSDRVICRLILPEKALITSIIRVIVLKAYLDE